MAWDLARSFEGAAARDGDSTQFRQHRGVPGIGAVLHTSSGGLKYLSVGNPSIPKRLQSGSPSAVQSTSAIITLSLSAYFSAKASQVGFRALQCPHHGASAEREDSHLLD